VSTPFLTARWRHLLMLNYAVDPSLLEELCPRGTVVDENEGHCFMSVVGFLFLDARVKGLALPGHQDFEELNLRFYVRREQPDEARGLDHRRGVVFVKELVPRVAIATVARLLYNENYVALPMDHSLLRAGQPAPEDAPLDVGDRLAYGFRQRGSQPEWGQVSARVAGSAAPLVAGSHPHFIAEHYWGYATQRDGGTVEYAVEHPPWWVHPADEARIEGDVERLYGPRLAAALAGPPHSAFIAEGSEVQVMEGRRLAL
jgi:uncharacterized protein